MAGLQVQQELISRQAYLGDYKPVLSWTLRQKQKIQ